MGSPGNVARSSPLVVTSSSGGTTTFGSIPASTTSGLPSPCPWSSAVSPCAQQAHADHDVGVRQQLDDAPAALHLHDAPARPAPVTTGIPTLIPLAEPLSISIVCSKFVSGPEIT